MRFEVPQFIEVEDKIFGPLSWRQFLYLGGGLGMAIVLFLNLPFILFVFIGIPLALFSAALAFYPVNNRPFSSFLESIANYISSQRLYLWRQESTPVYKNFVPTKPPALYATPTENQLEVAAPKKNIASLARRLELQALQKTE